MVIKSLLLAALSERAVVSVINAYNVDMGVDLEESPDRVLNKSSFHGKRRSAMGDFADAPLHTTKAVYLDGKRFAASKKETYGEETTKHRNTLETAEHIVVADAESGEYMGEFIPKSGSGRDVAEGLLEFLRGKGVR